jgi:hypothetical protein
VLTAGYSSASERAATASPGVAETKGLLNPGKNIPTLHRCAEFGAMHVHHGQLPFPDLERF